MKVTLGEKMRTLVQRAGFTFEDIRKATGLSQSTVRKIYSNKGSMGSWMVLCKFLNVELDVDILQDGLNLK